MTVDVLEKLLEQQLVNALALGGIYALIAVGFSLVFSVLEIINFSHGALVMSAVFISLALVQAGVSPLPAVFLTVLIVAGLGIIVDKLAVQPLRKKGANRVLALVSTIGVAFVLEALALLIWGGAVRSYPINLPQGHILLGSTRISYTQCVVIGLSLILMTGLQLFIRYTRRGRAIRATAQNANAAALMGIDVHRIVQVIFAIGSGIGAVAGVMIGALYNVAHPSMGFTPGIKGFIAAVLGGMGSVLGAGLGGIVLGLAEVLGGAYISFEYRDAWAFIILILIFIIRPRGILGAAVDDKL